MFIAFLVVINCDMKIIRLIFDIMSVLRISKNVLLISGVLLRETTNLSKYRAWLCLCKGQVKGKKVFGYYYVGNVISLSAVGNPF